jgi:multisubunit Na+/H+ antiporter MnhB subunit
LSFFIVTVAIFNDVAGDALQKKKNGKSTKSNRRMKNDTTMEIISGGKMNYMRLLKNNLIALISYSVICGALLLPFIYAAEWGAFPDEIFDWNMQSMVYSFLGIVFFIIAPLYMCFFIGKYLLLNANNDLINVYSVIGAAAIVMGSILFLSFFPAFPAFGILFLVPLGAIITPLSHFLPDGGYFGFILLSLPFLIMWLGMYYKKREKERAQKATEGAKKRYIGLIFSFIICLLIFGMIALTIESVEDEERAIAIAKEHIANIYKWDVDDYKAEAELKDDQWLVHFIPLSIYESEDPPENYQIFTVIIKKSNSRILNAYWHNK